LDATVPNQCEDFINIVLDAHPDKPWLYFGLGLINYRAKEDFESAKRDFGAFLDKVEAFKFPKQIEVVKQWLGEINAHAPL
jgi:hypothetical protein